jgi:hypothetical protein
LLAAAFIVIGAAFAVEQGGSAGGQVDPRRNDDQRAMNLLCGYVVGKTTFAVFQRDFGGYFTRSRALDPGGGPGVLLKPLKWQKVVNVPLDKTNLATQMPGQELVPAELTPYVTGAYVLGHPKPDSTALFYDQDPDSFNALVVLMFKDGLLAELEAPLCADYHKWDVAAAALNGEAALIDIALHHINPKARATAAEHVVAPDVLATIALEDPSTAVFLSVIERIEDQAVLARIAQTHWWPRGREWAVLRLKDQSLLAEIAFGKDLPMVRRAAAHRLEDQPALTRIALEDDDQGVRREAVNRLKDVDLLKRVVAETDDEKLRDIARARLGEIKGAGPGPE